MKKKENGINRPKMGFKKTHWVNIEAKKEKGKKNENITYIIEECLE